jgi:hypothetical protein
MKGYGNRPKELVALIQIFHVLFLSALLSPKWNRRNFYFNFFDYFVILLNEYFDLGNWLSELVAPNRHQQASRERFDCFLVKKPELDHP